MADFGPDPEMAAFEAELGRDVGNIGGASVAVTVALEDVEGDLDSIDRGFAATFGCIDEDLREETVRGIDLLPGTPLEVLALLESMARAPQVIQETLDVAQVQMMRRHYATAELRRKKWERKLQPVEIESTRRWLKKLMKRALTTYHQGHVADHRTPVVVPTYLNRFNPLGGVFIVDEANSAKSTVGVPGYMEQTPPMVVRWVYETWKASRLSALHEVADLDISLVPQVWDLTAGSGTVSDLLESILGGRVIGTDLSAAYDGVAVADARDVGKHDGHCLPRQRWPENPLERFVAKPELVFFDPPSMGTPTHSEVYDERRGKFTGKRAEQDLAVLDRADWVDTVSEITLKSIKRLAPGGYVSLIVRAGTRNKGKVTPDPDLLKDVKKALGQGARLVQEHPMEFRGRKNQFSLGTDRVPATHLLLGRPG